ncbi:prephenate dehydratase [Nocardioides sp. AE5]|uniref:prephenate dehydratase n=1 Tax=Nocardioides sp. AE5 TaxID=2962573 RepID=UPI0028823F10|nr:prephenate dehydratase [Nocardioides sp. AE5]MDT0202932.1 prephenate dehydratase [Nocardioides sp. AE5]
MPDAPHTPDPDSTVPGPVRYAYLGPEGTFTEQAARALAAGGPATGGSATGPAATLEPVTTVTVALDRVRSGDADGAVVPIENSVEGSVPVTLDELATGRELIITAEVTVPIEFSLLARPGTAIEDIRVVGTHPHGAAQTRKWVAAHLPGATVVHTNSTAAAAAGLADHSATWDAAITAPLAADHYRLATLATGVADNAGAETRFVLVTRPDAPPAPTGADKSSLVAFIEHDRPGLLLELLEEFALRGVNLSRIESRPTGAGLGHYCFSIDCEGHIAEARVGEALMGLHRMCDDVRFLGSYPRADGVRPEVEKGTGDADFAEAEAWLARLRNGR